MSYEIIASSQPDMLTCAHCSLEYFVVADRQYIASFCPRCGESIFTASPAIYAQRDPRWKDVKLGHGNTTIGRYGCLVCCLAMAAERASGVECNPVNINDALKRVSGFVGPNKNLVVWAKIDDALPLTLLDLQYYDNVPAPIESIVDLLDSGGYPIARVDYDPSDLDVDSHFVLIHQHRGDGVFEIHDPWTGGVHELPPAYCRPQWDAERAIFAIAAFN